MQDQKLKMRKLIRTKDEEATPLAHTGFCCFVSLFFPCKLSRGRYTLGSSYVMATVIMGLLFNEEVKTPSYQNFKR